VERVVRMRSEDRKPSKTSLADVDMGGSEKDTEAADGIPAGTFEGGVAAIKYPMTTKDAGSIPGGGQSHTEIITMYEACWFTSWSATFSRDAGMIMESGDVMISDIHDFASMYGEFLATGNDPTLGQLGSIRYVGGGLGSSTGGSAGVSGAAEKAAFLNTGAAEPI